MTMATFLDESCSRRQQVLGVFLTTYAESPQRVLNAFTLVDEGRVELFRSGATVGAVIRAPGREAPQAGYVIVQRDHCCCAERRAQPAHKCVHLLALEIVEALAPHGTETAACP
jgi:hypothetical protein